MEVISIRKSDIPKYHDGSEDKDFYTLDDVMHVALFGSDKEKEILFASMTHAMNEKLEHFEKTLKGCKPWN